ncbi:hypothetical protein Q671_04575 [Halomonas sp. PBN3]|nr:hypothetical protein Q671_04575 [Halomonas sp. PBN3]
MRVSGERLLHRVMHVCFGRQILIPTDESMVRVL